MNDMTAVIIPKSDQLNADSLIGGPMTIKIRDVAIRPGTEQPVSIFFEGDDDKPWKPCKSMSRVMVSVWGPDAKVYIGRSLTLYRDPTVKWGGMEVGGIRISHMSHMEGTMMMALTATKGSRKPYTVHPLTNKQTGQLTLETAKDALNGAKDMDELKAIWSNKQMAPFRDDLTDFLAERKAAMSTPADREETQAEVEQEADDTPAWAGMVADWKERIANADVVGTIIAIRGELKPHVDVLPSDVAHELYGLLDEAAAKFTTKGE
jgi:hypothetical protein